MILPIDLQTGAITWLVVLGAILFVQRTQHMLGVGLVLAYFANLAMIHLPGALLYLNPEYVYFKKSWVELGFEQSTFAIVAFGVGAVGAVWLLHQTRRFAENETPAAPVVFNPWIHRFYVMLGLVSYFVITPLTQEIPTIGAIVSVMNGILLLGICLGMWNAWQSGDLRSLLFWAMSLGVLPIMTILAQGFLGFGAAALLTGMTFLASFFRPRWLVIVLGAVFVFVGLSTFVTYFRDRTEIRSVVWGGESLEERADQLLKTFSNFEWFDLANKQQLTYIDTRLNQNGLVGAAVERVRNQKVTLRYGATMVEALIAPIPRLIWPDKPVRAGSGNLVTDATGQKFAKNTSVGVGQVLEFYYNFGAPGVVVGALLWGIVLALLDVSAARALTRGDLQRFTLFFLLGLSMIQPGGSLVDIAATAAASVAAAFVVNDLVVPFFVGAFQDAQADEPAAPVGRTTAS